MHCQDLSKPKSSGSLILCRRALTVQLTQTLEMIPWYDSAASSIPETAVLKWFSSFAFLLLRSACQHELLQLWTSFTVDILLCCQCPPLSSPAGQRPTLFKSFSRPDISMPLPASILSKTSWVLQLSLLLPLIEKGALWWAGGVALAVVESGPNQPNGVRSLCSI